MRVPTPAVITLALLLLPTLASATAVGDADGNGTISVSDGVQIYRAAGGLQSPCTLATCDVDASGSVTVTDAVQVGRAAIGLGATAVPRGAATPNGGANSVNVHFTFNATAGIQGLQIDVSYPLAKGGFAGSADAVACTSNGDGFFVANDRDDGTMALLQANVTALTMPFEITCRFEQSPGEVLDPAELGVTITEVTENGAPGDPSHLLIGVTVGDPPIPTCALGAISITTDAGAILDLGWNGIAHRTPLPAESSAILPLDCPNGPPACEFSGAGIDGAPAGAPLAISVGGVNACVLNEFQSPLTGTFDCDTGCLSADVHVLSRVYLTVDADHPCPSCIGDPVPNDGARGGICYGGTTPGGPCDAQGLNSRFDTAGTELGTTSRDCLPTGSSVGELALDLDPLTTGTASRTANVDCLSGAFPPASCFCPGQVQPNSCIPDGVCPASGFCENGPLDGVCSVQRFRQCLPDSGTTDCDDIFPGAGTCVSEPRPCFGTTIERTGACGIEDGALAAVFCVPATRAAAINTVYGLPGPAAVSLPIRIVAAPAPGSSAGPTPGATPQPTPAPGSVCSATARTGCHQLVRPHEATLVVRDRPNGTDELAWRWLGGTATDATELGNPIIETRYGLCMYTNEGFLFQTQAGPETCRRSTPCWRATNQGGFVYTNHFGNADGLTHIELTPGLQGASRVVVKGRNKHLTIPRLPIPTPLTVQLQADNGTCWEATYEPPDLIRNDETQLRAIEQP